MSEPDCGTYARYRRGCRCAECKAANVRRAQEWAARRRESGVEITHGVIGYGTFRCRCAICRRANADRHTRWRNQRRTRGDA